LSVALECLTGDLRVQRFFEEWLRAQDQHRRDDPPAWVRSTADCDRAMEAVRLAEIDLIDLLADLLRTMGALGGPNRYRMAELLLSDDIP